MVWNEVDPLTGAGRDALFLALTDADREMLRTLARKEEPQRRALL